MTVLISDIKKYTDMWREGYTPSEIIAAAWDDKLEVEKLDYLYAKLCNLEGVTRLEVNIPVVEYYEC